MRLILYRLMLIAVTLVYATSCVNYDDRPARHCYNSVTYLDFGQGNATVAVDTSGKPLKCDR